MTTVFLEQLLALPGSAKQEGKSRRRRNINGRSRRKEVLACGSGPSPPLLRSLISFVVSSLSGPHGPQGPPSQKPKVAVNSLQCEVYNVQVCSCNVLYKIFRVQYAECCVQCEICSALWVMAMWLELHAYFKCVVCSVQCVVCSVQSAVCSVQCAVCSVQCAVCSVKNTWGFSAVVTYFLLGLFVLHPGGSGGWGSSGGLTLLSSRAWRTGLLDVMMADWKSTRPQIEWTKLLEGWH